MPEGIGSIRDGEWERIEMTVDSGASETVINEGMVLSADLVEGSASKR